MKQFKNTFGALSQQI